MWRAIGLLLLLSSTAATCWAQKAPGAPSGGSIYEPIPMIGTETRAERAVPPLPRETIRFRLGGIMATLERIAMGSAHTAGLASGFRDASTTIVHDEAKGARLTLARGGPEAVYLEGARVVLREPLDVLASGDSHDEYWSASAGFEFRF